MSAKAYTLTVETLVQAVYRARDLASLVGNNGKKIRLGLEALLREGVMLFSPKTSPLVFTAQVEWMQFACKMGNSEDEGGENSFGLRVEAVITDFNARAVRLTISVEREPQNMRTRQQLLHEIADRLSNVENTLSYSAPSDPIDVLSCEVSSELEGEELDREVHRLSTVFDRLVQRDFSAMDKLDTVPLKVIELAAILEPEVANAFRSRHGKSLELALEGQSLKLQPAEAPSLRALLEDAG